MNADIRLDHCNAADFKVKQHLFEIRKLFVELALFDDVAVGQIAYSTNRFSVDKNGEKRTASYYVPATAVSVGLDLGSNRAEGR